MFFPSSAAWGPTLKTTEFVPALLRALPDQEIQGRKRLQKLAYLLKLGGAELEADFRLSHYGPFSRELAEATDLLTLGGIVDEVRQPSGVFQTFVSLYSLVADSGEEEILEEKAADLVRRLDKFTTVVLEVAATIGYLTEEGMESREALAKTKSMKPTKTTNSVIEQARESLDIVNGAVAI